MDRLRGVRGMPQGRGTAVPNPTHARHAPRRRLWHARHCIAWPLLLPHQGVPRGARHDLHLLRHHRLLGTEEDVWAFGRRRPSADHRAVGGSTVDIAPAAVEGKVVGRDIDDQKRAHARQMGAVATIDNAAPDAVKQVMEATGGGAAAAIDFVGSPRTMEFGVNILRKGGKLVMVGLYGGAYPVSTLLFRLR
jgi:Zinc-binding dehydrogenase